MLIKDKKINLEQAEKLLVMYYSSTGIPVKCIDITGKTVAQIGDDYSFCNYFHSLTDQTDCNQTHLYAGLQSQTFGEAYVFFCHACLTEFTHPILHEGVFYGALVAGPVLMAFPDEYFVDEILKKNHLEIEHKSKIKSYVRTIPLVEPKRVRHLSMLLQLAILGLNNTDYTDMKILYDKKEQQKEILNHISQYKSLSTHSYPLEKEQALMKYVRLGQSSDAKRILNELLGYIFFDAGIDLEVSKSRALEMSALISRAAIEGGADATLLFGISNQYIQKLQDIQSMDNLSFWMLEILNNFTEHVINVNDSNHPTAIRQALKYIHNNYNKALTLADVSEIAELSPKYFSATFKKEMNIAFSDYINNLRINEAKRLLSTTNKTILTIALELGFEDQSYFTKVFKKQTELTPLKYRKLNI